jgi:hypothetical protein
MKVNNIIQLDDNAKLHETKLFSAILVSSRINPNSKSNVTGMWKMLGAKAKMRCTPLCCKDSSEEGVVYNWVKLRSGTSCF